MVVRKALSAPFVSASLLTLLLLCRTDYSHGGYIYKNGKLFNEKYMAKESCDDHFNKAMRALESRDFLTCETELMTVIQSFPDSSQAHEAPYYIGIVKFEESELDIAHRYFSTYVHKQGAAHHYEDLFRYKLAIATRLANGEKRHLFGIESLPKLMTGRQIAIDLFDEIAKAMPYQEIAAEALLEKGALLKQREEFSPSIDCCQEVVRKFPRTAFSLRAFVAISECYRQRLAREPHNSDALALAEINVKEAQKMFPSGDELKVMQAHVLEMKEQCARSLFETGELYERMQEPKAAVISYLSVVRSYPETEAAKQAYSHATRLKAEADALSLPFPKNPYTV